MTHPKLNNDRLLKRFLLGQSLLQKSLLGLLLLLGTLGLLWLLNRPVTTPLSYIPHTSNEQVAKTETFTFPADIESFTAFTPGSTGNRSFSG